MWFMVFRSFRQVKPVSVMPLLLIFALLGVLVFQYTVLQCAASGSGSQQAVWVDRTAYSPGETVVVSVNGTFFNSSNLTAYIIPPTLAVTGLALTPSEAVYTGEYSPMQDVVLGTYTVFVSGGTVTETTEFDIRMLSVYPDLEQSYPLGNISISGNVTDTATGNPVNASVTITIDGLTFNTSAVEGFFSTDYQALSTGLKSISITAIDDENMTGTASASFEVYTLSGDTINPVINSVSDFPDPVERGDCVTITADVTGDFEVGTVLVEINGTEYPMSLPESWMNRTGLFFDGFESGSLATKNWTVSGTGDPWQVEEGVSKSYEGTFNALASGSGEKILETEMDTAGYENLNLSLYYGVSGLSSSGYFAIDWYDGEQWNSIFNFSDHTIQYTSFNSSLPEGASDNPDFKLRFRCSLGPGDTARIDNVELTGMAISPEPYGYLHDTSGMEPGVYIYTVRASDSSGNVAAPMTGSFIVLDGIPGISSVLDSPDPVVQGENITISVDPADGFEVRDILVNIGGINYTVAEGINTENELFFDGFESGSLETENWTCSGSGNPWFIHYKPNKAYEGDYSLLVINTDGNEGLGASSLETEIDTSGYSEINLSFYYKPGGLDEGKLEYFSVDWYDGEEWNCLLNTSGIENEYLFFNATLPDAAGDNPDFKIRFNCYSTNSDDSVRIDNVEVKGKRTVSGPFDYSYNTSALSPGVYAYTVYAIDTLGREASPVTGSFTVREPTSGGGTSPGDEGPIGGGGFGDSDTVNPVINSVSDSPDPAPRGENFRFTANVTDNVGVGTVLLELEGTNYTMSRLRAEARLFSDDFESGSLETQNWTNSGTPWTIGADGLTNKAVATNTGGISALEKSVDTAGYENITFSFEARTQALDAGEYLEVDWYNGTQWINLLQTDVVESTAFDYQLPAGAGNNSDFKIRFFCNIGEGEYCYVDNVEVNGTGNVPDMYEYSFDSSVLLPGTRTYTVYANDSAGNPASPLTGNFTVINSPPYLPPIGPRTVNEPEPLSITLPTTPDLRTAGCSMWSSRRQTGK